MKVKYRRRSSADYGGCADVAAKSCWRTNWRLAARRWRCGQAATQNLLPTDSLLPPPIDGLMNGLPLAHELLAHVRNPDAQPHSINLTQLPISEADRLFLSRLCGPGNIQIRTIGYGESYINATGLRHVWHLRCTDTLKGPLLESYEICPIPEVVLAAPEDLVDSAQRLSEVCQWLAEAAPT